MKTIVIKYNAGNIRSVDFALKRLGLEPVITDNHDEIRSADRVIFPGVGDAAYAMQQLKLTGFDSFLKDWAESGKPILGICLGSQIVFDYSEEGDTECLGLLKGSIRRFSSLKDKGFDTSLKVPHIGWNNVSFANGGSSLLNGVAPDSDFYFVHSYVIQPEDSSIIKGYADYGIKVPAIVEKDNIAVFQFHPEKSGALGLQILRNFCGVPETEGGASC